MATAIERLSSLLRKGYFPKELPHAFTTQDFGRDAWEIREDWRNSGIFKTKPLKYKKKPKAGCYQFEKILVAEPEIISTPKKGYERRDIHITHPVPQLLLSEELCFNWKEVMKWLSRQEFSNDEIRIGDSYTRSIKGINFDLHRIKKGFIEASSDWIVKTDITRFYPSIYTHSIAWAAYGKEAVKADIKKFDGSLADRLDVLVRACNRNQTAGIPIGPETSRILSEIISSRIDQEFIKSYGQNPKHRADRLQDDWFMGFESLADAEQALAAVVNVYRQFNLEINGSKTSVDHVLVHREEEWHSELSSFLSHRDGPLRGARLREFLNLVVRLQVGGGRTPVSNYALSVLESQGVAADDVEIVESFLLKTALVSPRSFDRICAVLLSLQQETKKVSLERIRERFTQLLIRCLQNEHTFEALWILYTFRGLGISVSSKVVNELVEPFHSSALSLVMLDLRSRNQWRPRLPADVWQNGISERSVEAGAIWLLGYEGFRHGWLNDTAGLMGKRFFEPMARRNVVFYDPRRNVPTRKKRVQLRRNFRRRSAFETAQFLMMLRGIDADDDY